VVKVTKIVEKSLSPEKVEEIPAPSLEASSPSTAEGVQGVRGKDANKGAESPLLSKLGPKEEKKKVDKVEFSDKLGALFGVDPAEIQGKS